MVQDIEDSKETKEIESDGIDKILSMSLKGDIYISINSDTMEIITSIKKGNHF
jgi:hypothetical protein